MQETPTASQGKVLQEALDEALRAPPALRPRLGGIGRTWRLYPAEIEAAVGQRAEP
jgi:hypothetical protein